MMCAIALSRRAPRGKSSPSALALVLPSYAYFLSFLGLSSCCCTCTEAISLTTQRTFTSSSSSNFRWLSKQHHPTVGTFQYGLQQNNYQGFTAGRLKHGISSSSRHGLFSSSSSSRTSSLYSTTETEVTIQEIDDDDDDASTTTTTAADTDTDALTSFKKWGFINDNDGSSASSTSSTQSSSSSSMIRNLLVCGDGDLSYSAEISSELQTLGIELVATVLEEEDVHNQGKYLRLTVVVFKLWYIILHDINIYNI